MKQTKEQNGSRITKEIVENNRWLKSSNKKFQQKTEPKEIIVNFLQRDRSSSLDAIKRAKTGICKQ